MALSTDTDFDHNYHLVFAHTDHRYMQGFLEDTPEPVFAGFAVLLCLNTVHMPAAPVR